MFVFEVRVQARGSGVLRCRKRKHDVGIHVVSMRAVSEYSGFSKVLIG